MAGCRPSRGNLTGGTTSHVADTYAIALGGATDAVPDSTSCAAHDRREWREPLPRPLPKSGRNEIQRIPVTVEA